MNLSGSLISVSSSTAIHAAMRAKVRIGSRTAENEKEVAIFFKRCAAVAGVCPIILLKGRVLRVRITPRKANQGKVGGWVKCGSARSRAHLERQ